MSKVVYIAGATRSGTTLADILIGSLPGYFSCGELMYFSTNGLMDKEYCSCGKRVPECDFWKQVASAWQDRRVLSLEDYNKLYFSFLKNKSIIKFIFRIIFPDKTFRLFQKDTLSLYEIIWSINNHRIIVDSSKSPYRLLLLKSIGIKVEVIHIIRDLRGVLFSAEKELKQNAALGVEKDIHPKRPLMVAFKWVYVNQLIRAFSIGLRRSTFYFDRMVNNPYDVICNWVDRETKPGDFFKQGGPFIPAHLVAGGRVRMEKEVYIKPEVLKSEKWQGSGPVNWVVSLLEHIR